MPTPTFDAPQSPIEAILQNMLGANNTLRQPQSRNEALLLQILDAMQHGGGDVTAEAVLAALQDMTDEEAAAALNAIGGASKQDISTVFHYKGSLSSMSDLPATGNDVGDVWFVEAEGLFVWLEDEQNPDGFWDEFGQLIDLSGYELKPTVNTGSGQSQTITPADNNIYECGVITALTLNAPAAGANAIVRFIADQADVAVTVANSIKGLDDLTGTAGNLFEISFRGPYALWESWPYTPPIS